ncbi:MAG: SHOCT domain-containing protein [Planctomycetota bacterium]
MERLLEADAEKLVIWIAALAMLLVVGIYVIDKVRAAPAQHEPTASELLSKCRESHSRGELTDEEFRTIKTTLEIRLREELNGDGETG